MALVVRTTADTQSMVQFVRRAVWSVDNRQPVFQIRSMNDYLSPGRHGAAHFDDSADGVRRHLRAIGGAGHPWCGVLRCCAANAGVWTTHGAWLDAGPTEANGDRAWNQDGFCRPRNLEWPEPRCWRPDCAPRCTVWGGGSGCNGRGRRIVVRGDAGGELHTRASRHPASIPCRRSIRSSISGLEGRGEWSNS